jgi:excisionase family DNA binding protein
MNKNTPKEWLSPKEFAETVGVTIETVWRWLRDGKLAHMERRPGMRLWRIHRSALEAVISEKEAKTEPISVEGLPEYLTAQQFAELMDVKIETVWGWLRNGQLSHLPISNPQEMRYLIPRSEVNGFRVNRQKNKNVLEFPPIQSGDDDTG